VGFRLNPPPGWPPVPEGFVPPPGWQPDPAWPAPPPGWQLWLPDDSAPYQPYQPQAYQAPPPYGGPAQPYGWPAQPYGGWPPAAPQPGSGLAITSLVLGILGFLGITSVLGVIFGIVALVQIRAQRQRGKGLAIAGIAVSAAWIVLFASLVIAAAVANPPPRNSSSGPASSGQVRQKNSVDVFSLRVGQCFDNPPGQAPDVNTVPALPCTRPHNAQVFAEFAVRGDAYPGLAALQRRATSGCNARIARLDQQKVSGNMEIRFLFPRLLSWYRGHREIACIVTSPADNLKSSVLAPPVPAMG